MQNLIRDYTDVTKRQSIVMEKANAVMACLVKEIQEFKKTTVYKMHEENKKNFDYEKHT
jgi:mRNA-degrading endonuclease YafQ of YafQ-DinJ toxin-antitoxin module